VKTVSGVCFKRVCSLDTSAFSALEVPDDNCALYIYLLTYLSQPTGGFEAHYDMHTYYLVTSEIKCQGHHTSQGVMSGAKRAIAINQRMSSL